MRGRVVRALGASALGLGAFGLVACAHGHGYVRHQPVVVESEGHPGPPAHAPAHGYRRKHGVHHHTHHQKRRRATESRVEVELVFDENLGVHVVVGHSGVYFHAARYYRLGHAGWEWSARLDQHWVAAPDHGVPTGLRKLHPGPKKSKKVRRSAAPPPVRRDHVEQPSTPAQVQPPQKAAAPRKSAPPPKARGRQPREDPPPEHRHQHDEHPGRGWH
jgi:hypothetical protein